MKKYNKVIAIVMVMMLSALALAGCGSTPAGSTSADAAGGQVYKIGISQLVEHPALDAATQGFQDALIEKLGEGNVEFDVQNAQGETANASTIASGFVASEVDLIMANATPALQAAAAATADIPILGTSVTDYATALEIDDWTGVVGTNVSGTADLAPLDQQAAMFAELVPDAKKIGLLYCSAEPNSGYQISVIKGYLEEAGLECVEYAAADSNEIQSVVTKACQEVDAIYIPTDNTIANNTELVNNIAQPAGIPIIAGEEGMCSGCGIATLSISYYDLGYKTGLMAYEILVNGADVSTMEVAYADTVTKKYNEALCTALGITVPEDYEAIATE